MLNKVQLRGWQEEAFALYLDSLKVNERSILWEATPGAGKTTAALHVVNHQLSTKRANHAIVVVPTSHLRIQWSRAAKRIGLELDSALTKARQFNKKDFHGAVFTYQQIGLEPNILKRLASNAVIVLDEIHHAGDGLTWGQALRAALADAPFVLALSGTAFRSDSNAIPFVKYDKSGLSTPDFTYPYARAIEDGVCRPTAFFTYGGEVSWVEGTRTLTASFSDSLEPSIAARRLRAALDTDSGWIEPMLKDAHTMLMTVVKDQPDAAGLVVCADQSHARKVAKLVESISYEKPTIVLSDDSTASKKIHTFASGKGRWLVACNMVSEGVDIPRLRVGVYATTVRTKMYFRQFLGRIVRKQPAPAGLQVAYLYLPADRVLHNLAEEIEIETRHSLTVSQREEEKRERNPDKESPGLTWSPLAGINGGVDSVIVHGNQLSLFGGAIQADAVQQVIHQEIETRLEEGLTRSELKAQLTSDIKKLVGLVHRRQRTPHSAIHMNLNRKQGLRSQASCTEDQLRERIRLLQEMLGQGVITGKAA